MEKFCLKWNDYEKNLGTAFNDLREEKELFNVSLISEDGSQVEAHKVVLSACSPFFRNILLRNTRHHHPLLFLKGVRHRDLVSLLDFMYRGQVNIAQEDLSTFLSVAEELKVKGLTQAQKSSSQTTSTSSGNTEKNLNKTSPVKLAPPPLSPLPPPPYRPPMPMPQLMPSSSSSKPAPAPPDDDIKCLGEGSSSAATKKHSEENIEDDDTLINVVDPDPAYDEPFIDPVPPRNEEGVYFSVACMSFVMSHIHVHVQFNILTQGTQNLSLLINSNLEITTLNRRYVCL